MQRKFTSIILAAGLILSSALSFFYIYQLKGNARVINYTGVVRGASQRLVIQELNDSPNDALISKIGGIIEELITGEGENDLRRLPDGEYQKIMSQVRERWQRLKEEICLVRANDDSEDVFTASESFFELADKAVTAAEKYTEHKVLIAVRLLFALTCASILLYALLTRHHSVQDRRQRALSEAEEVCQKKSENLSRMSENIRAPMNDISELMYVSDLETYELLFVNETGRQKFHIDTLNGQKCYRVLQRKNAPCEFCTNSLLREGETYTWEHTNALNNRHYLLKDRLIEWDGRRARIEIAFDMTESEKEKTQLKYTLDAEKMITECVRTLYQGQDISEAMDQVLALLGNFLSADRAYLFSVKGQCMCNEFEWCSQGTDPQIESLQNLPVKAIDRWMPAFNRSQCIIIEKLEDLKDSSPEEYRILHKQKITSMVVAPMERNGRLAGYLGVDNPPSDKLQNIGPLLQTLCYFILLAYRQSESQRQLSHMSYFDSLTSFYNRNRYMEDTKALGREETSVGVVYLDVNGLKDINDQYGHAFGDKVLVECANRMKNAFTDADYYRIGGDEFVIINPGITYENFENKVQRLKETFGENSLYRAAIGAKWAAGTSGLSQTISEADAKMYEDKKQFYRRHPQSKRYRHHNDVILRLADAEILKEELQNDNFVVYLQPVFLSTDHSVVGAEALVRYRTPANLLIPPEKFLPTMEDRESISQIDFFVLNYVCKKLKTWTEQGRKRLPVSVNFSRSSLSRPSFVEQLTSVTQAYDIPPEYIIVEITESANQMEPSVIGCLISKIHTAGFVVAIDDFGTKYADFALLSSAAIDVLKLDKSMVDGIASNSRAKMIVKSIADICRELNICMVAEGVETQEQLSVLRSLSVGLVQGFVYSKPLSEDAYELKCLK